MSTSGTSPAPGSPPARGWYPDPWSVAPLRWWDGQAWTSAVSRTGLEGGPRPPEPEGPPTLDARALPTAIAAYVGAGAAAVAAALATRAVTDNTVAVIVAAQAALYGVLLFACRHTSRRYGTGRWRDDFGLRVRPADAGTGAAAFFISASVANLVATVVASSSRLQGSPNERMFDIHESTGLHVAVVIIAVIGAPFVEELFFRGLLLRTLAAQTGPAAAIGAQAVLFGLAHIDPAQGWHNVNTVLRVGILGLGFGYIAQERRRLGPGMVAHAITNVIAVVVNLYLVGR